jgi:hypothetical protein
MTAANRFLDTFIAARKVGTPLIATPTPDAQATTARIVKGSADGVPVVLHDACRGFVALNPAGQAALTDALMDPETGEAAPASAAANPLEALMTFAPRFARRTVLCMVNVHSYLEDESPAGWAVRQAIWNLRDQYKGNLRTLVLLGPAFTLPPELSADVLVIPELLPDDADLAQTVARVVGDAGGKLAPEVESQAVNALRGLSLFPAEQATALAIRGRGAEVTVDLPDLWTRKEQMIAATPGLSVWKDGARFSDVGGCDQVKGYLRRVMTAKVRPEAILFMDEGEKMWAGATSGDNTGVSQDFMGAWLTWQQKMNDRGSSGCIFLGPPGAAKTMVATACGGEFGVPTISLDGGALKASLVGESERRIRQALAVVEAISGGRVLVIMTCNKDVDLPPEFKRRFIGGLWYFDLPSAEERALIWRTYLAKFGLLKSAKALPPDQDWTGAEIKQACTLAANLGMPLAETGQYIVPVAKSAAEQIAALRRQAAGRYLSASYPGPYRLQGAANPNGTRTLAGAEEV